MGATRAHPGKPHGERIVRALITCSSHAPLPSDQRPPPFVRPTPRRKNAAYDFFPCQFQLLYRGKGKGGMWYDPTFQVGAFQGAAGELEEAATGLFVPGQYHHRCVQGVCARAVLPPATRCPASFDPSIHPSAGGDAQRAQGVAAAPLPREARPGAGHLPLLGGWDPPVMGRLEGGGGEAGVEAQEPGRGVAAGPPLHVCWLLHWVMAGGAPLLRRQSAPLFNVLALFIQTGPGQWSDQQ